MPNDMVAVCPRCHGNLMATRLSCKKCELELNGDFPLSKFDYLSPDEIEFIESFLESQGSFKTLQNERNMSYPAVKKKYNEILEKLNLLPIEREERVESDMTTVDYLEIKEADSLVVKMIKEKLNENSGKALIPLYSGDMCEIKYDPNGKGLISPKIPIPDHLTWEVFEASVEVVLKNDGKVMKGKARSGAKLGSDDLPIESLEGYIAHKVHGVEIGKATFGPGFVVAAILDWADVCNNERGFVTIKPNFQIELQQTRN